MRPQIELKFYFGAARLPAAFKTHLIGMASALCGGCFVADGAGYWVESDGPRRADSFEGSLATEETLCIGLTTEPHKVDRVLSEMEDAAANAAIAHGADVDWVHVQQTQIMGRHFSVKAAIAQKAAPVAA